MTEQPWSEVTALSKEHDMSIAKVELAQECPHATWELVRVETSTAVYFGRLYVPGKDRLSDVLADERPFLHLRDVTTGEAEGPEPYTALSKSHIRNVRLLNEREQTQYVMDRGYVPGGRPRSRPETI
jgi:hypothetical protein